MLNLPQEFCLIRISPYPIGFYEYGDYLYKRLNNPENPESVEVRPLHEINFPARYGRFGDVG